MIHPDTRAKRGESLVEAIVALALLTGAAAPALSSLRLSLRAARTADAALAGALALHPALRDAQARFLLGESLPEWELRAGGRVQVRAEDAAEAGAAVPAVELTACLSPPPAPVRAPDSRTSDAAAKFSCEAQGFALSSVALFQAAPARGLQCPSTDNFTREPMAR